MRDFFVLSRDDREDLEFVSNYEMGEFDLTTFWAGQRFNEEIPSDVRLWVATGNPSDYLANPVSWPIISERLWALIEPLARTTCQLVTVPLYREDNITPVK